MVLAVVATAALCALAPAAPLGSQPHRSNPSGDRALVTLYEIPSDAEFNSAALSGDQFPGLRPEAIVAAQSRSGSVPEQNLAPYAFSFATLLALGSVLLISVRNLKSRPGRRKRLEYSCRPMAPLM